MIPLNVLDKSGNAATLNTLDGAVVEPIFQQLVASPSLSTNGWGTTTAWQAKAVAGRVLAFHATNGNVVQRYLQIFNGPAAPGAGAVPVYSFLIPAGTAANPGAVERSESFFGLGGVYLGLGVAFAVSTTLGSYTPATPADHIVHAHYE